MRLSKKAAKKIKKKNLLNNAGRFNRFSNSENDGQKRPREISKSEE